MAPTDDLALPTPFITIVIATYAATETLPQCLHSIEAQQGEAVEVVVVDGDAGDETAELARTWVRQSGVPGMVLCEPDSGIYDAWNTALRSITGEWVLFLGADDRLHDHLALTRSGERLRRLADPATTGLAYGNIRLMSSAGPIEERGAPWSVIRQHLDRRMLLPHPATFHHHTLLRKLHGFDPSYRSAGDYEFLLRAHRHVAPEYWPDIVVTDMAFGGASTSSRTALRAIREARRARTAHGGSASLATDARLLVGSIAKALLVRYAPPGLLRRMLARRRRDDEASA